MIRDPGVISGLVMGRKT